MEQEAVFHKAGSSALDPLVPGAGMAAVRWVRETPPETRGVTGLPGPCLGSKWLLCHMQWSVGIHTHTHTCSGLVLPWKLAFGCYFGTIFWVR